MRASISRLPQRPLLYAGLAALLVICAALPWFWVPPGHVIAGIDNPPRVDFGVLVQATSHTWDPAPNGGISNFVGYGMYWPFLSVGAFLQTLGWSAYAVSSLLLSFTMLAAGAGIYCFCRALGTSYLVALAMTAAYELNFAHAFMAPTFHSLLAYAAIAWIPYVILRSSQISLAGNIRLAALCALASTLLVYVKINPPSYATFVIVFVVALLVLFGTGRLDMRRLATFAGTFLVCYAGLNAWWLYDFAASLRLDPAAVTAGSSLDWVSAESSFSQVLALRGSWALGAQFAANPYFSYASWYANPLTYAAMLLVPFGAYCCILRYRGSKAIRRAAAVAIVLTILAAGYHPPFGWLFGWLLVHAPGMWLFREPLTKFDSLLLLTYVIVVALAATLTVNRFDRRIFQAFVAVFTIGCIAGGWPLLNGSVVRAATQNSPSNAVAVPPYWLDFARWANGLNDSNRIAMLPQAGQYQFGYRWGYYGPDIDGSLLRHAYIDATASASYTDADTKALAMSWYATLHDAKRFDARAFNGLTRMLRIEYAVYRRDLVAPAEQPFPLPESDVEARLRQAGFEQERRFGDLVVFKNRDSIATGTLPIIPDAVAVVSGDPYFDPRFAAWHVPVFASASDLAPTFSSSPRAERTMIERTEDAAIGLRGIVSGERYGLELTVDGEPSGARFERPFTPGDTAAFVRVGDVLNRIENGVSAVWGADKTSSVAGTVMEGSGVSAISRNDAYAISGNDGAVRNVVAEFVPDLKEKTDVTLSTLSLESGGELGSTTLHYVPGRGPLTYEFPSNVAVRFTFTPHEGMARQSLPLRSYGFYAIDREMPFSLSIPPSTGFKPLPPSNFVLRSADFTARIPLSAAQSLRAVVSAPLPSRVRLRLQWIDAGGEAVADETPGVHVALPPFEDLRVSLSGDPQAVSKFVSSGPTLKVERAGLASRTISFLRPMRGSVRVDSSSQTRYEGTYSAQMPTLLFMPQAYSNGWQLRVSGEVARHVHANGSENAWVVPAGTHHFVIEFRLEKISEFLRQTAVGFAFVLLALTAGLWLWEIRVGWRPARIGKSRAEQ